MNIRYTSPELAEFYSRHRNTWQELYPSERYVFGRLGESRKCLGSVLDVGCAAGGVGRALSERFKIARYVGIDINAGVIRTAVSEQKTFPAPCSFICGDIVDDPAPLQGQQFDLVCSLSCADWNLDPLTIIQRCWSRVVPGGHLILSLRLTNALGVNDMSRSYQFIHFGDGPLRGDEEKANYVVFNVRELLGLLSSLQPGPGHLLAYGYWGKPSRTAVTPYPRLVFAVLALLRSEANNSPVIEATLPLDLLASSPTP
ncbi:MAG: class I SAM-dependent methyltransferase [Verrucomicrobia bacterium]|nr:class I SAM-dependent methyltransferase [Verrucomicrobiota bacterium]